MGGSSITTENLDTGIKLFSKLFIQEKIEHFVFFGSLLGLVRNGAPIEGDDDVDFYVNIKNRSSVIEVLSSIGIKPNFHHRPNHTNFFIQAAGSVNGKAFRVDFYFYDAETDKNFVIDSWNFTGIQNDTEKKPNVLKIPKPLIYPLYKQVYKSQEVYLPRHPEIICEFLYGINWKIPQTKDKDYKMVVIGGRPLRYTEMNGNINVLP